MQEQVDERSAGREAALPQLAHHALHDVAQAPDHLEPEEAARALDGVDRPEELVDLVGDQRRVDVDPEEDRLYLLQELGGLDDELAQ